MAKYVDLDKIIDQLEIQWGYEGMREELYALPAADVAEVRRGRWEQCFEDWRRQIEGDKCSACGFEHYGCSIAHYQYCPNCGAQMDGGAG